MGCALGMAKRGLSVRGLEERVGGSGNRRCMVGHVGLCFISVKLHSEIGQHQRIRSAGSTSIRHSCLEKVRLELHGGGRGKISLWRKQKL